jgi:hypothetical protein
VKCPNHGTLILHFVSHSNLIAQFSLCKSPWHCSECGCWFSVRVSLWCALMVGVDNSTLSFTLRAVSGKKKSNNFIFVQKRILNPWGKIEMASGAPGCRKQSYGGPPGENLMPSRDSRYFSPLLKSPAADPRGADLRTFSRVSTSIYSASGSCGGSSAGSTAG